MSKEEELQKTIRMQGEMLLEREGMMNPLVEKLRKKLYATEVKLKEAEKKLEKATFDNVDYQDGEEE